MKFSSRRVLLVIALILMALILLPVLGAIRRNFEAVRVLHFVSGEDRLQSPVDLACKDYLQVVFVLHSLIQSSMDNSQKIQVMQTASLCLPDGRKRLLIPLEAEVYGQAGEPELACQVLKTVAAGGKLLQLAEQAYEQGLQESSQTYLDCLRAADVRWAGVSPYRTAYLYNKLGNDYAQAGRDQDALEAFSQSIAYFPGTWSAPVVGMAQVQWQLDNQEEAFRDLQKALSAGAEPGSAFQLWRQAGFQWQAQGKLSEAWCAFQQAHVVESQAGDSYAPQAQRDELDSLILKIASQLNGIKADCRPVLDWAAQNRSP